MDNRTNKQNYYLDIADSVLNRATCLRRKYGAIIVRNDEIISTGYNGAPRGRRNCSDLGFCTREFMKIPSGERYELCRSVHAEANAITKVAKSANNCDGSTLYITAAPCIECSKLIIQAGIKRVVYLDDYRSEDGLNLLRRVGIECVKRDENEK